MGRNHPAQPLMGLEWRILTSPPCEVVDVQAGLAHHSPVPQITPATAPELARFLPHHVRRGEDDALRNAVASLDLHRAPR